MTAGIGFIILIVLTIIGSVGEWLINLIRDEKIEIWINKTPFGAHDHRRFNSIEAQDEAYVALQAS